MKYHVYLAGPISGLTYDGAQSWRDEVKAKIHPDIKTLSPLRGKEYLKLRGPLEGAYDNFPMSTDQGLTARDRYDCTRADIVLFNLLGASRISIGTMVEMGWADAARRPAILVIENKGNPHDYPMIRQICQFRVDNLEDGIKIVEAILVG